jgi:hypothetical protein
LSHFPAQLQFQFSSFLTTFQVPRVKLLVLLALWLCYVDNLPSVQDLSLSTLSSFLIPKRCAWATPWSSSSLQACDPVQLAMLGFAQAVLFENHCQIITAGCSPSSKHKVNLL